MTSQHVNLSKESSYCTLPLASIFLRQLDGVILVLTCMHMYVLACMHIMHIRRLVDSNPLKLNRTNRTFRVDIDWDRSHSSQTRSTTSNRPFAVVGSKLIYYSMDTKGGRSLVLTDLEKCIGTNAVLKNVCILGIVQDPWMYLGIVIARTSSLCHCV